MFSAVNIYGINITNMKTILHSPIYFHVIWIAQTSNKYNIDTKYPYESRKSGQCAVLTFINALHLRFEFKVRFVTIGAESGLVDDYIFV